MADKRIAVVIPCYRVKAQVAQVIQGIGPEVSWIICVDDACPDGSGEFIREQVRDPRVSVIRLERNQGVGGATSAGYRAALEKQADVVVKLDGDGQMDPKLIPALVKPILGGSADYTKGNRFYNIEDVAAMPLPRLLGNAFLSFASKFSSGYWSVLDPTNGFTAVHGRVLALLPLAKLSPRWFFESDMLFRLNTIGAVIADVPMRAVYVGEKSNLNALGVIPEFAWKHFRNYLKRIFYNYFLRGFSIASVELLAGLALLGFGIVYGAMKWESSVSHQAFASAGTVMLAALPVILGFQLVLSFLSFDMQSAPTTPLQGRL
ncbi:MAG TPA: glycosyltransferase family 2 protein [Gammaproteobacteria bacterium]|nr:glycosyltransferase family 2 protein [Gammaproteobacteria bacterium]